MVPHQARPHSAVQSNMCYSISLFQGLLLPQERRVSALPLPAVGGPRVKPRVALPADLLVGPVLVGQNLQGRLDDTTPQPEDQVEGRLLLDVVVGQGSAVLELLAGEDEPLLIRG